MTNLRRGALLSYWRALLALALTALFLVQGWDAMLKFVKRQTTVVTTVEASERERLPVLSFCPGYRRDEVDYYAAADELAGLLGDVVDDDDAVGGGEELASWEKAILHC